MIDRNYCLTMARYNRWQNKQLEELLQPLSWDELTRDRGAFFGSIMQTLSHIYWGDWIWMSRFDGRPGPGMDGRAGLTLFPTLATWSADRFRMDGRISLWANRLDTVDLTGDLTWYSGSSGREVTKPLALLVVHFFNHQTHHRGQVHAMLTATGSKAPVSDLFLMPEDV